MDAADAVSVVFLPLFLYTTTTRMYFGVVGVVVAAGEGLYTFVIYPYNSQHLARSSVLLFPDAISSSYSSYPSVLCCVFGLLLLE